MLARLIYGFRISASCSRLLLAGISSVVGIAAGAVQGYFGGWTDLIFQRFIEVWSSLPHLYLLIIISAVLTPAFFVLLGILLLFSWVNLVHVVRAEFLRARNFEYVNGRPRARASPTSAIMTKHLLPNAMVATLTFLPFVLNGLDHHADVAGLPGLRPAARLTLARRDCCCRASPRHLQAPWLGLTGFFTIAIMLSLLVFIGRGGARRLRSAQDVPLRAGVARSFDDRVDGP